MFQARGETQHARICIDEHAQLYAYVPVLLGTSEQNKHIRIHVHTHTHTRTQITLDSLTLEASYWDVTREEPCTMLLFDFFLHDTQHSLPMLGMSPQATLRREMEVMVDSLFLSEHTRCSVIHSSLFLSEFYERGGNCLHVCIRMSSR